MIILQGVITPLGAPVTPSSLTLVFESASDAEKEAFFVSLGYPAYDDVAAANLAEAQMGVPYYDRSTNRIETTDDIA